MARSGPRVPGSYAQATPVCASAAGQIDKKTPKHNTT